jgi:signal transduction histidine kinase
MLTAIRSGTDRLVKLTEDLMLLVQIDSGLVAMEIAHRRMHTDVNMLISEVLTDLSKIAQNSLMQFEVTVDGPLDVLCVPYYVQDALTRVIHNAIKFSTRGSQVLISATQAAEHIIITVQDTGIGMEADQIALIFERFRQLNRESLEQQGVGLGLTIAMNLVHLHNGRLEVESSPGYGTKVTITLPVNG